MNSKAGKAAALPKFSDMLTLYQSGGTDYPHPLALPHLFFSRLRHCTAMYDAYIGKYVF